MKISLGNIALMCGGVLTPGSDPTLIVEQVVIDSREIKKGTLFIAIKGELHDGHDFVSEVLANGAAGVIVENNLSTPNLIQVKNTIQALGLFAHNYRLQFAIPVVGITGSNGKTTVKEMLRNICIEEFGETNVLATAGNLNNHIGMPLTLLKLTPKHKVAIIEMGMNHAHELDYLSKIANPTLAVVNNVMLAHAGFFKDLTDIALAKGEIYNGLVKDGVALINQNSPFATMWHKQLHNVKHVYFGGVDSMCYLKHTGIGGEIILSTNEGEIHCYLKVLGEHNKLNAVTAASLALKLKCKLKNISQGLEKYTGYKGRLEQKVAFNGALIIDDSYNANPDSVKAAILAIKDLTKPHWFIFADLKELGQFTESAHEEIAKFAMEHGIDKLLTIGEFSKITDANFVGDKMHFLSNQDIVEYCQQYLPSDATLLVKGSNSMKLTDIVLKLVK